MTLTIVGLGPGHPDDLTRRAWQALESAAVVMLRTAEHPCVPHLPAGPEYRSCDDLYEAKDDFDSVYAAIAERVLDAAAHGDIVYAVPGDPANAESTVKRIRAGADERNIPVQIVSGVSFVEPALALVGVDALDGLQLFDAITLAMMHHPPLNPDHPALLGQVYSRDLASNLKLTLMNQYPDEFPVTLIHAAGTPDAVVEPVPLYEIDRSPHIRHLTALYLPALGGMSSFEQFQEVIAHLRAPEGCPWDREQTHLSLRPYLIEETYEVLDALNAEDPQALREELGDLLLQIVLHTQIATEDGEFRMADVLHAINTKMIQRHPHVWGDTASQGLESVDSATDGASDKVVANWETLKQRERVAKGQAEKPKSLLDGVPKSLPALLQAYQFQNKAAKVGFDWPHIDHVIAKVREELDEVLSAGDDEHLREELGDLLFVVVNWARWHKIDPENALRSTNDKFGRRFRHIEEGAAAAGRDLKSMTLAEMDAFWDDAKARGL
ncbi:MAG: nucleoside triphosphate pyrophosphohydrolase [Chloroflexi bacterium]|nr:nucleoside triphosphate pyrophosphohydrolase [Chloroflexota bacterium]